MQCKILQSESWDLELAPKFVNTNKKVIDILTVSNEDFEKSLNCGKQERNDLIFKLLWNQSN